MRLIQIAVALAVTYFAFCVMAVLWRLFERSTLTTLFPGFGSYKPIVFALLLLAVAASLMSSGTGQK